MPDNSPPVSLLGLGQRGRSVFTFVIDYHHLSVDSGAGGLL
jgi:hypothetical protein